MKNRTSLDRRQEYILAALLIVLGCAVRLIGLGALPCGLNQDEASAGYEALALLQEGIDRCGNSWPVLFVSWGSGQNALMSYLALPFVALMGLSTWSVRLPNAIAGCLTLFVFWRMARRSGEGFGLAALGLLAVNPWHIMISRWGLESNLLPFFLLAGIWLAGVAEERPWALVGAAVSFAMALYAYGTAFFFLPPFLVFAVLLLRKQLRPAPFFVAMGIFLLLALPIGVCQFHNILGLRGTKLLGMTLPKLTESRQLATSVLGGGGFAAAESNLRGLIRILWRGSDGLSYNALPFWQGGIFYFFGLPTAVIGFLYSLLLRKDRPEEKLLRLALTCALLCACLISGNINRLNMIWLPLIYFSALGCWLIVRKLGRWAPLSGLAVLACFLVFLNSYTARFDGAGSTAYFPGLGDAITAAEEMDNGTVYITDWVNQPYIFALFYTETAPSEFIESVEYQRVDVPFRQVLRFRGFEFVSPERAKLLILHRSEAGDREILAAYGCFVICQGDP